MSFPLGETPAVGVTAATSTEGMVFDLNGVEESTSFEVIPKGTYNAVIEELEFTIAQLEEELGSATDTVKILELTAKYDAAKRELDAKMEEWAELSE